MKQAIVLSSTAQSAIIYTDITDVVSDLSPGDNFTFGLDLDGDAIAEVFIRHSGRGIRPSGPTFSASIYSNRAMVTVAVAPGTNDYYTNVFSVGDTISAAIIRQKSVTYKTMT